MKYTKPTFKPAPAPAAAPAKVTTTTTTKTDSNNIYCVLEQGILTKTSKILKAFNTEAKAKAFASSTNTTADYNIVIEPIKLE